jgi:dihydrolipoamide dehydrogenase
VIEFDIGIIGGGPGGYTAAIRAAQQGASVCLVEKGKIGGTCLHRGCIPTKAFFSTARLLDMVSAGVAHGLQVGGLHFDVRTAIQRKNKIVSRLEAGVEKLLAENKVEIFRGRAALEEANRIRIRQGAATTQVQARSIILAPGSEPLTLRSFPVDGKAILTSEDFLALDFFPASLVIIGGGYIGCELAGIAALFGTRVVLIEKMPELLTRSDPQAVREMEKQLTAKGVAIYKQTEAALAGREGGRLQLHLSSQDDILETDMVLCALGRKPNSENLGLEEAGIKIEDGAIVVDGQMRTSVSNIFAIGDVADKMQLAHVASYQAEIAVKNALGGAAEADYNAVPATIFTFPEIARVGLSERQCRESSFAFQTGWFSFQASGKALCDGKERGLAKIFAAAGDGRILGASIHGEEAASLIAEVALSMQNGITVAQLAAAVHSHPTLPEIIGEAADDVLGRALHKAPRRKRTI